MRENSILGGYELYCTLENFAKVTSADTAKLLINCYCKNPTIYMWIFKILISADDLSSDFGLQGIPVQSLHGNREQCDREQALDDFKKGKAIIGWSQLQRKA